jgi:ABC-type polysaccharide/polyol phosphate transport system ATPase subunit
MEAVDSAELEIREAPLPTAVPEADVVRMTGVSFRYRRQNERLTSLKEYAIRRLQGRVQVREIWAVRDIDLSVRRGEVFGIIGRNGAGKSTLLRLIAGVLRPSSGRVVVHGWPLSPLLEIGAGFHPDLTGRENVYLNGTLLGHSKREVAERYESIVDFAELAGVMDEPLRTYSSGMMARLGFSVATAWEPKVLLVDEVLAVGDEAFQKKCQARIEEFRRRSATVLLVSHQLAEVVAICSRAALVDGGRIRAIGDPQTVVKAYWEAILASGRDLT